MSAAPIAEPIMQVDDLHMHFKRPRSVVERAVRRQPARSSMPSTASASRWRGRDARHRRRIRLRQVDARALPGAAASSRRRARSRYDGTDVLTLAGAARRDYQPPRPDGLPGPVRLAQSAHDGPPDADGGDPVPSACAPAARSPSRVAELLGLVRLPRRCGRPLSARIQRRPAPAHRHRARPGGGARLPDRGRARLGPRRLGAGADHQPAARAAAAAASHPPLHRPRSAARPAHLASRRGHVSRRDRGAGGDRDPVQRAGAIPIPRRC